MANILDFFTKGGQARTQDLIDLENRIAEAARYYLGPTGIDKRAGSAVGLIGEIAPTTGITNSMAASGRGDYGEAAVEGASALLPVGAAKIAGRYAAGGVGQVADDAASAVSEFLTGFSAPARDAGRVVAERLNQRGPMPTVYSNPLLPKVDDYAGSHRAPRRDPDFARSSLDDPRDIFGGDDSIYSNKALQYYGSQGGAIDAESMAAIKAARGNPDAEITVYRAIPKGIEGAKINAGDWVTPSRSYAKDHGEGALGGDYKIVTQKVRAGDLFTEGDINEWGFDPKDATPSLPPARNEAEAMAKRILDMRAAGNAADVTDEMMAKADQQYMFNNTPLPMDEASRMERAREMGFDADVFKGMRAYTGGKKYRHTSIGRELVSDEPLREITEINAPNQIYLPKPMAGFTSSDPNVASDFQSWLQEHGAVYPLRIKSNDMIDVDFSGRPAGSGQFENFQEPAIYNSVMNVVEDTTNGGVIMRNTEDEADVFVPRRPEQLRSRFARFDPAFAHLKNLSAGVGLPVTGLLGYNAMQQDQR